MMLKPLENKIQVTYFYFYAYNFGKLGYGNHVGDIESTTILFDKGLPI
jgi:hypothetical protein